MTTCSTHQEHDHKHGSGCGHKAVQHDDHTDYLHDNHLHFVHGEHTDEHVLTHEAGCTPGHSCEGGDTHKHGDNCGHERVPHLDHMDFVVGGHLHHQHEGHCDHHGSVS